MAPKKWRTQKKEKINKNKDIILFSPIFLPGRRRGEQGFPGRAGEKLGFFIDVSSTGRSRGDAGESRPGETPGRLQNSRKIGKIEILKTNKNN